MKNVNVNSDLRRKLLNVRPQRGARVWRDVRPVRTRKYAFSKLGLVKKGTPHHVFACARYLSPETLFNLLARLFLGELPVRALYQHRSCIHFFIGVVSTFHYMIKSYPLFIGNVSTSH